MKFSVPEISLAGSNCHETADALFLARYFDVTYVSRSSVDLINTLNWESREASLWKQYLASRRRVIKERT